MDFLKNTITARLLKKKAHMHAALVVALLLGVVSLGVLFLSGAGKVSACDIFGNGCSGGNVASFMSATPSTVNYADTAQLYVFCQGDPGYSCVLSGGRFGSDAWPMYPAPSSGTVLGSTPNSSAYVTSDAIYGAAGYRYAVWLPSGTGRQGIHAGTEYYFYDSTVYSNPYPSGSVSASPTSMVYNASNTQTSQIGWYGANADFCQIVGPGIYAIDYGAACGGWHYINTAAITGAGTYGPYTVWYGTNGTGWIQGPSTYVTVTAPTPTASISASPTTVYAGQASTISWSSSNVSSCTVSGPGVASTATSGSPSTGPLTAGTKTYSIVCSGTWGSASNSTNVTVNVPNAPTATITANGQSSITVRAGASVTLSAAFTINPGDTGTGANIDGDVSNPGGEVGGRTGSTAYSGTKTYTFTPTNAGTYTYYARLSTATYPSWATYATATVTVQGACASGGQDITGWGWSDSIGWVSANCATDTNSPYNYGLKTDAGGNVTGYAWSDAIGWISANPTDTSGCGSAAHLTAGNPSTFTGWFKALAASGSWDGCISLKDPTASNWYQVTTASNNLTSPATTWSDAAWGGQNVGWIEFNIGCALTAPVCTDITHYTNYKSCFVQTVSCNAGSVCANGTGCVSATPTGCLNVNSSSCTPAQKTARLQKSGTASLYWNVSGVVTNCSIVGSNGQTFSNLLSGGAPSGSGTVTTSVITAKTTYTLSCDNGAFTDTTTINMTPVYQEI